MSIRRRPRLTAGVFATLALLVFAGGLSQGPDWWAVLLGLSCALQAISHWRRVTTFTRDGVAFGRTTCTWAQLQLQTDPPWLHVRRGDIRLGARLASVRLTDPDAARLREWAGAATTPSR